MTPPSPCCFTAFVAKTAPSPCCFTAFVAKTAPLACASAAFATKTLSYLAFPLPSFPLPSIALVDTIVPLPCVSTAFEAKTAPSPCGPKVPLAWAVGPAKSKAALRRYLRGGILEQAAAVRHTTLHFSVPAHTTHPGLICCVLSRITVHAAVLAYKRWPESPQIARVVATQAGGAGPTGLELVAGSGGWWVLGLQVG